MSQKKKKVVSTIAVLIFLSLCAVAGYFHGVWSQDNLRYKGESYIPMHFPQNIFYYDFIGTDEYIEEDEIFPIEGGKYQLVYRDGDVYCAKQQEKEAVSYYADDRNYRWQLTVWDEKTDKEETFDLTLTAEEIDYLEHIEKLDKDLTLFFDQIELQGTLEKISNDETIIARTELAYYQGKWYWRSEEIDDREMKDDTWPEYIYPMPDSFQDKIKL